jgi:hypothetical protein
MGLIEMGRPIGLVAPKKKGSSGDDPTAATVSTVGGSGKTLENFIKAVVGGKQEPASGPAAHSPGSSHLRQEETDIDALNHFSRRGSISPSTEPTVTDVVQSPTPGPRATKGELVASASEKATLVKEKLKDIKTQLVSMMESPTDAELDDVDGKGTLRKRLEEQYSSENLDAYENIKTLEKQGDLELMKSFPTFVTKVIKPDDSYDGINISAKLSMDCVKLSESTTKLDKELQELQEIQELIKRDTRLGNTPEEAISSEKASTLSQLDVALENYKLACDEAKVRLFPDDLQTIKDAKIAEIETAYKEIPTDSLTAETVEIGLKACVKKFRDKHDDFGLQTKLGEKLDKKSGPISRVGRKVLRGALGVITLDYNYFLGKKSKISKNPFFKVIMGVTGLTAANFIMKSTLVSFPTWMAGKAGMKNTGITGQARASYFMSKTKPAALLECANRDHSNIENTLTVGDTTYTSTISEADTTTYCTSAQAREARGVAGNFHFQTVKGEGEDKLPLFDTGRHAALSVKKGDPKTQTIPKGLRVVLNVIENKEEQSLVEENTTVSELEDIQLDALSSKLGLEKGTPKKEVARKLALREKVVSFAQAYQGRGPEGTDPIVVTSMSLLTPDPFRDEVNKYEDQVEAFKMLDSMSTGEKQELGIERVEIISFNFGVNEGERFGVSAQRGNNKLYFDKFVTNAAQKIGKMDEGSVEREHAELLLNDIKTDFTEVGKRWTGTSLGGSWRADQAYSLAAKISVLSQEIGDQNAVNCASGKDRTGFHLGNAIALSANRAIQREEAKVLPEDTADLRTETLNKPSDPYKIITDAKEKLSSLPGMTGRVTDGYALKLIKGHISRTDFEQSPAYKGMHDGQKVTFNKCMDTIQTQQKNNRQCFLESGQFEVQQKCTGSKGFKLYGQTGVGHKSESYQEEMLGCPSPVLTRQANNNAT